MLNVIGGAQPIDVLRALTHLILTCGFPHDVVLHRMSSRYLLYISFLKNSLVHGHYGDSNRRPFEIPHVFRIMNCPHLAELCVFEALYMVKSEGVTRK